MFEGWSEFYLMAGGAAAVLIGLIFVVISLMQDRSRSSVLQGSRLYMGPIVLGVSFVLVLSAAALAPHLDGRQFALIAGGIAIWGLARGVISTVGIHNVRDEVHWTDIWFYGLIPIALYVVLGIIAWCFWTDQPCARPALAGFVTAGLLLAIRNEWDLITWIAPRHEGKDDSDFA